MVALPQGDRAVVMGVMLYWWWPNGQPGNLLHPPLECNVPIIYLVSMALGVVEPPCSLTYNCSRMGFHGLWVSSLGFGSSIPMRIWMLPEICFHGGHRHTQGMPGDSLGIIVLRCVASLTRLSVQRPGLGCWVILQETCAVSNARPQVVLLAHH